MEAIIGGLVPATFIAALVLERLFPARPLPKVKWWLLKCLGLFIVAGVLNTIFPALVAALLGGRSPFHLGWLGPIGGGIVGYLAGDFVSYLLHRLQHNVPFLWRWTHQMHHSAERVDVAGVAYFHPFDILLQMGVTTLAVLMLGISTDAAVFGGYISLVATLFGHMNVRTPRWVGFVFQRPEAHSIHHARGVHAYNYGTFMLWDLALGTFRNPTTFSAEPAGFWDGASRKVGAMLLGRDVGEPS
jgi:sterol desaturase/sphingolipid hydroxylase (fatty acid hydroxylase superfamily)